MSPTGGGRPFPYVSYLRVYEPLDAFSDAQQLVILEQRARERTLTETLEHEQSLRRILRSVSDPFPHHEADLVRVTHFPGLSGTDPHHGVARARGLLMHQVDEGAHIVTSVRTRDE